MWGLPLIVLTVLAHCYGLVLIHDHVVDQLNRRLSARRSTVAFAAIVSTTALLITLLHAAEAVGWAAAYLTLGALHDPGSAMLFSLDAMTTYGHDDLGLRPHWRLMGALEALTGLILFGLTTAYFYRVIQVNWPSHARDARSGQA